MKRPKRKRKRATGARTGAERALEALGLVRVGDIRDTEKPAFWKAIDVLSDLHTLIDRRDAGEVAPQTHLRLVQGGAS